MEYTDLIIEHGYTGLIHEKNICEIIKTLLASIATRRLRYLNEFRKGLQVFDVSTYVKSYPQLFAPFFDIDNTEYTNVDGTYIATLLRPIYSEQESTRRQVEETIMDMFEDFLYEIDTKRMETVSAAVALKDSRIEDAKKEAGEEEFEEAELTSPNMLFWLTGQKHKPIDHSKLKIVVYFDNDCFSKYVGHTICFPVVHSCSRSITLPVAHMKSPESFRRTLYIGFCKGQSFART